MIEKRLKSRSVIGTLTLGETIMELMLPGPRLILLRGDLGAGKTTLVRGIAQAVGAPEQDVSSPTFTLVHTYQGRKLKVYHLDLYRLEKESELLQLGLEELEAEPDSLTLVEWGEKFPSVVARARAEIAITQGEEPNERQFYVRVL